MSHEVNTHILEEAYELSEECAGTLLGHKIDMALHTKNLDWCAELIKEARDYLRTQELQDDEYPEVI